MSDDARPTERTPTNQSPLKPTAMMNFKKTNAELAQIVGEFWHLVWARQSPAIDQNTKYLLSLANAVGARRFRQATRELIKAYAAGTTVDELDELFCLFVWNQGAGEFASEIGPSSLFAAYQMAKQMEERKVSRDGVVDALKEHFGEANPAVGTQYQSETHRITDEGHR